MSRRCTSDDPLVTDTPARDDDVMRTGGVESPQPMATRLQRAGLAGARRPQGGTEAAGRIRTDTAGLTTPDARRYITAAKLRGGAHGSPTGPLLQARAQVTLEWPPEPQSRPPAAMVFAW